MISSSPVHLYAAARPPVLLTLPGSVAMSPSAFLFRVLLLLYLLHMIMPDITIENVPIWCHLMMPNDKMG